MYSWYSCYVLILNEKLQFYVLRVQNKISGFWLFFCISLDVH